MPRDPESARVPLVASRPQNLAGEFRLVRGEIHLHPKEGNRGPPSSAIGEGTTTRATEGSVVLQSYTYLVLEMIGLFLSIHICYIWSSLALDPP